VAQKETFQRIMPVRFRRVTATPAPIPTATKKKRKLLAKAGSKIPAFYLTKKLLPIFGNGVERFWP
jgi:hypothetical protein